MRKISTRSVPVLSFFLASISLCTCKVVDPAEDIPSYVRIERIDLVNVNTQVQGTAAQQLTEAWVYVDNELIGGFELPATIPVLNAGEKNIKVAAGVLQNGINATRAIYPFFRFHDTTATLARGQTLTLRPRVEYFTSVTYAWLENFENPGLSLNDMPGAPFTNIFKKDTIPGHAFEGNGCGYVRLDADTFECRVQSSGNYDLPTDGHPVYLELHYKCNNPFVVGMMTDQNEARPWITVNPSATWNKIYIDLTSTASQQPIANTFKIYFAMPKQSDVSVAEIFLDNIKLLHL